MGAQLPSARKSLSRCPKEPATKLSPPILVLDLFVILHIVTENQVRTPPVPHLAANLLLSSSSQNSPSVPITHSDDQIGLGIAFQLFNSKLTPQIIVLPNLFRHVREDFRRVLFSRSNQNDIIAGAEEAFSQDVGEGKGCSLGVLAGGYQCGKRCVTTVKLPSFSMKLRRGRERIVARGKEGTCEGLD